MSAALEIRGLEKRFGATRAVDGLDLVVPAGELFALLGPNGAGKTTTLRLAAGLLAPDAGSIRVAGHDVAADPLAAKRVLAFLPDEPQLYAKLRPLEYLAFVAGLWGLEPGVAQARARDLLALLGLEGTVNDPVETYSRGMKQKLVLAGALLHDPAVMILDEPLTGLDAAAARLVKDLLAARAASGRTVILSTHILEVAERVATRLAIVSHGRVVAGGTMADLRAGSDRTLEDIFLELTREAP
ncbi:MAG: ABC transporter ATP-binding protein [Betaproteobacteria bacterium]|nr:ABC transporter ATP-binding protein [Betaproteobacteria bacterium]